MQLPTDKPLILAHRGARTQAPENTLAAFRLAFEQGADGIELDVRLAADGEVVVFHDETLQRITGVPGRVNRRTLAELKSLDAGVHFSPEFRGERIPTLREVFSSLDSRLVYDIELTDYHDLFGPLAERVVRLVKEFRLEERVLVTSFNPAALRAVRRIAPEFVCGLIAFSGWKGALQRSLIGRMVTRQMIVPHHSDVDREYLLRERRRQRKVITWTVNSPEEVRRLAEWRIDGIITDRPDLAVQAWRSA